MIIPQDGLAIPGVYSISHPQIALTTAIPEDPVIFPADKKTGV
jgi:hypothetical protein